MKLRSAVMRRKQEIFWGHRAEGLVAPSGAPQFCRAYAWRSRSVGWPLNCEPTHGIRSLSFP